MEVVANCAISGFLIRTIAKWEDDFKTHKSHFAQHLINAPDRASITNWYNPNTKNSGTIKTNTFLKDQLNVELGKA